MQQTDAPNAGMPTTITERLIFPIADISGPTTTRMTTPMRRPRTAALLLCPLLQAPRHRLSGRRTEMARTRRLCSFNKCREFFLEAA
jgi:hypothetical protein